MSTCRFHLTGEPQNCSLPLSLPSTTPNYLWLHLRTMNHRKFSLCYSLQHFFMYRASLQSFYLCQISYCLIKKLLIKDVNKMWAEYRVRNYEIMTFLCRVLPFSGNPKHLEKCLASNFMVWTLFQNKCSKIKGLEFISCLKFAFGSCLTESY